MDILTWLEEWYKSYCDEDWEHSFGVKISTLDNPGWDVSIDLEDTDLENVSFATIDETSRDKNNWIYCKVADNVFRGAGGPMNLIEILFVFKDWVDANNLKVDDCK